MSENNNQIENFNLARGWEEVKLSAKSNLIKEIAEKHGIEIIDLPLAAVGIEDTYGIPVPENVTIMGSGKFTPHVPTETTDKIRHVEVDIQSPSFKEIGN